MQVQPPIQEAPGQQVEEEEQEEEAAEEEEEEQAPVEEVQPPAAAAAAAEEAEEIEPEYETVEIDNPVVKPADSFIPLQTFEKGRCPSDPNFPDNYYIVALTGDRRDWMTDVGHVNVVAVVEEKKVNLKTSRGLITANLERESVIEFEIRDSNLALYRHPADAPADGFVRAVIAFVTLETL